MIGVPKITYFVRGQRIQWVGDMMGLDKPRSSSGLEFNKEEIEGTP